MLLTTSKCKNKMILVPQRHFQCQGFGFSALCVWCFAPGPWARLSSRLWLCAPVRLHLFLTTWLIRPLLSWGWILSSLDRWTATLTIVSLCLCDIVPRCALPDLPVSLCTGFGPHQWCGWEHCKYWTGWTPLGPLTPWHICSLIVNKRTELPNRVYDWVACLFLRDIQKQFVNQNLWYILYIKLGLHVTCKSCNNTLH